MPRSNGDLILLYKNEIMKGNKMTAEKIMCEIIKGNRPMINHHIKNVIINKPDKKSYKDDMEQEAVIALMKAVNTYDSTRDASFDTYAYDQVQYAILHCIARSRLIPIPYKKLKDIARYYDIVIGYKNEHNNTAPSEDYIIEKMGVTKRKYRYFKSALEATYIDDLDSFSSEAVDNISHDRDPVDGILIEDAKKRLIDLLSKLKNIKERQVIYDYYYGAKNISLLAKKYNVSEQRISKLKSDGIKHLAALPEAREIAEVLLNG